MREMTTDWYPVDERIYLDDFADGSISGPFYGLRSRGRLVGFAPGGDLGAIVNGAPEAMMATVLSGSEMYGDTVADFVACGGGTVFPDTGKYDVFLGAQVYEEPGFPRTAIKADRSFESSHYNPGFFGNAVVVEAIHSTCAKTTNVAALGAHPLVTMQINAAGGRVGDFIESQMPGWYVAEMIFEHHTESGSGAGRVVDLTLNMTALRNATNGWSGGMQVYPTATDTPHYSNVHRHGSAIWSVSCPGGTVDELVQISAHVPNGMLPTAWGDEAETINAYITVSAQLDSVADSSMRWGPNSSFDMAWHESFEPYLMSVDAIIECPRVKFVLRNDFPEMTIAGGLQNDGRQFRKPRWQ